MCHLRPAAILAHQNLSFFEGQVRAAAANLALGMMF